MVCESKLTIIEENPKHSQFHPCQSHFSTGYMRHNMRLFDMDADAVRGICGRIRDPVAKFTSRLSVSEYGRISNIHRIRFHISPADDVHRSGKTGLLMFIINQIQDVESKANGGGGNDPSLKKI